MKEKKNKDKPKVENLTERDIKELMGCYRDKYRKVRGRVKKV